jgi:hypothetical protein
MTHQIQPIPTKPIAVSQSFAAKLINSTIASLNKDRCVGHLGIPYIKAGRKVIYLLADLEAWLKSNRITPQKKEEQYQSSEVMGDK